MVVEDRFVETTGGQLFSRSWWPEKVLLSEPLILLHDSLGSVDLWRDIPIELCDLLGRPVIAYDRLGFGQSTPRTDFPSPRFIFEEAEIHFPNVLQAYSVENYCLFGYSVGGVMALTIASGSSQCQAVISESAQSFIEARTIEGVRQGKLRFSDPAQFARLAKWHGERTAWVLRSWIDIWLSPEFANWSLADVLPTVTCPVLVFHGDLDEFGSTRFPETICELTSGPCQIEVFENCGHMPHRERHDDFLRITQEFLERIP